MSPENHVPCAWFRQASGYAQKRTSFLQCRRSGEPTSLEVKGVIIMNDIHPQSHSTWNCKYHVVFAPKYRRKVFGKAIRNRSNAKEIMQMERGKCFQTGNDFFSPRLSVLFYFIKNYLIRIFIVSLRMKFKIKTLKLKKMT